MRSIRYMFCVYLLIFYYSVTLAQQHSVLDQEILNTHATSPTLIRKVINSYYVSPPYQSKHHLHGKNIISGMDIKILNAIANNIGLQIVHRNIPWSQHKQSLQSQESDIVLGATYNQSRDQYAYFSTPYRFEENSLFVLNNYDLNLDFHDVSTFLASIRFKNFHLAIIQDAIYADPQINLFISNSINQDIIHRYENNIDAFHDIMLGKVHGLISDRVVGSTDLFHSSLDDVITEIPLNIKTPICIMFNKQTMDKQLVRQFNDEIAILTKSDNYTQIIKSYLYPVLLLHTINSEWFYFMGLIGTIAFAISGTVIAIQENATLFTTFLFAMLPSIGGVIIRDVLINREEIGIFLTPSYIYYIIIIVLISFCMIRVMKYHYYTQINTKSWLQNLHIFCDIIGQSVFLITGVCVVIMSKIDPIELWGPLLAFFTANGGCILRNALRQKNNVMHSMTGNMDSELSLFWGFALSVYLSINAYDPNPTEIEQIVILIVLGSCISRTLIYYFKFSNIRFFLSR